MIILISAIVMLIGLLLYALVSQPKISECGRIMFACGLFITLYLVSGRAPVKLL